ncbi:hypothetical protein, variant [Allomyces macrogynus ATCC 38327]|uniref:histone acetyltransferase n=1 Tax=Allomyces macrogynus (strain ATCC 38327) TaxID=578462 RepID=A0A0L0SHL4_ALLM3|nr:hypothetical protein, variant [Allomyces macrogynus ATCC 38327]|eukprot:KNE61976.1 hypothetical protein, variant [Allomyces macrogynus ATCC 38327]
MPSNHQSHLIKAPPRNSTITATMTTATQPPDARPPTAAPERSAALTVGVATSLHDQTPCPVALFDVSTKPCRATGPVPGQSSWMQRRLVAAFATSSASHDAKELQATTTSNLLAVLTAYEYDPIDNAAAPRIVFVDRVDSTGRGGAAARGLTRAIVQAYLASATSSTERATAVHIYAKAAGAYLLPQSDKLGSKRVLDGRQLTKWWIATLRPLVGAATDASLYCPGEPDRCPFPGLSAPWKYRLSYSRAADPRAVILDLPDHELTRFLASDAATDATTVDELVQLWDGLSAAGSDFATVITVQVPPRAAGQDGQPSAPGPTAISHDDYVQLINAFMAASFATDELVQSSSASLSAALRGLSAAPVAIRAAPVSSTSVSAQDPAPAPVVNNLTMLVKKKTGSASASQSSSSAAVIRDLTGLVKKKRSVPTTATTAAPAKRPAEPSAGNDADLSETKRARIK